MINFIEHFSCEFTDEEKEKCCEVIGWMVEYATKARMWGLLGLESELENGNISTDVLKEGLALIVDAKQSDKVREILLDIMEKGGYAGFDLLKRIIMAEGVLLIQDGYHPVEIAKRLSAILGEQYTSPIEAAERMEEGRKARGKFIDELNESEKASVNNGFENGFSEYGDALWYYLEKMNIENLICALHGCSKSFIVSTIDAAPLELDFEICRRWDEFDGLSDEKISEAMTLVLKEVKALYYALVEEAAADELEQVRNIITEHFGKDKNEIRVDTDIKAYLEADENDMTEFAMAIEEKFQVIIPDVEIENWCAVGDIVNTVVALLEKRGEEDEENV